jgi:hypothetical protein
MKAKITITGQPQGNRILANHLTYGAIEIENLPYGNFCLHFKTIGEAKKAIKTAYRNLKNDGDLPHRFSKSETSINYDASYASIN